MRFQEQTFYFHLSPNQKSTFIETSCDVVGISDEVIKSLAEVGPF